MLDTQYLVRQCCVNSHRVGNIYPTEQRTYKLGSNLDVSELYILGNKLDMDDDMWPSWVYYMYVIRPISLNIAF